jgi:hypothetical protein
MALEWCLCQCVQSRSYVLGLELPNAMYPTERRQDLRIEMGWNVNGCSPGPR